MSNNVLIGIALISAALAVIFTAALAKSIVNTRIWKKEAETQERAKRKAYDNALRHLEMRKAVDNELRYLKKRYAGYYRLPNEVIHDSEGNVYSRVGTINLIISGDEIVGWCKPGQKNVEAAETLDDIVDEIVAESTEE